MIDARRWLRLALTCAAVAVALASILVVSAHDKAGPHKKLFDGRWHYQPVGSNYGAWMTLTTSPIWLECATSDLVCAQRWQSAFSASVAEWNGLPTTVDFSLQQDQDVHDDVNVFASEFVLDDPSTLGLLLAWDASENLCDPDSCSIWRTWILVGDAAHAGPLATAAERKATIVHELGHAVSLRHESVNADESLLYPCGQDNTGNIPHSVMAYNCIDPSALGGAGETFVQKWDVCGVNHAYHDPTIGYAFCDIASSATADGALPGDADCNGTVTVLDAAVILQFDVRLLPALPCPQNADANDSGAVTIIDASLVLQYTAGRLPSLPP